VSGLFHAGKYCTLHATGNAYYSSFISNGSAGGTGKNGKCFHIVSGPASKEGQ
jgi:hypothetical protein